MRRPDCRDKESKFPKDKWAVPKYMYQKDTFPSYVSGSGYLIPVSDAGTACLFQKGLDTPYLFLEDVFVTGIAREKCGLGLVDATGIHPNGKDVCKVNKKKDLLIHYVKPGDSMQILHNYVMGRSGCRAKLI